MRALAQVVRNHQCPRRFRALLAAIAIMVTAGSAEAAFRYGQITWTKGAGNTAHIRVRTAWRTVDLCFVPDEFEFHFGDEGAGNPGGPAMVFCPGTPSCSTNAVCNTQTVGTFTDFSGVSYTIIDYVVSHTYPSQGPWTAFFEGCCRSAVNTGGVQRLQAVIDMRNNNMGSPVSSLPVIIQMVRNQVNTVAIPIADPDGDTFTCRLATQAECGIATHPTAGGNPLSVTSGCTLNWNTTGTTAGQKYATQVVVQEIHSTNTGRIGIDFLIEIIDSIPPGCSGGSGLYVINPGEPLALTLTGTDASPGIDLLTVNALGTLPSGATLTPPSGSQGSEPFNVAFNWTPSPAQAGTAHAVNVQFTDNTGRQGFCAFSVQVTNPSGPSPVCNAGGPYSVPCGSPSVQINLNGSGSSDPQSLPLTYQWSTNCAGGTFNNPNFANPTLTLPVPPGCRNCTATLVVTNSQNISSSCQASISVTDTSPPTFTQSPQNASAVCDGNGNQAAIDAWLNSAQATDTCGSVTIPRQVQSLRIAGATAVEIDLHRR